MTYVDYKERQVSVPIRGLFFLTHESVVCQYQSQVDTVSVPIRGLFFSTLSLKPQVITDRKMQKTAEIAKPTQKAL